MIESTVKINDELWTTTFMGRRLGTLFPYVSGERPSPAHAGAEPREPEPRWPAVLAILATGGLYFVIPASLRFGQEWLLLAVVSILLVPTVLTHRIGMVRLNRILLTSCSAF